MTLEELKEVLNKLSEEYTTIANSGVAYACVILSTALVGVYTKDEVIKKLKEF